MSGAEWFELLMRLTLAIGLGGITICVAFVVLEAIETWRERDE